MPEVRTATTPKASKAKKQIILKLSTNQYHADNMPRGSRVVVEETRGIDEGRLMAVSRGQQFWIGIVSIYDCARLKIRYKRQSVLIPQENCRLFRLLKVLASTLLP